MLRFLRESIKEFDHVVWPTRRETVRYFTVVVSTIVVFSIFLFIIGTSFSTSLFALRGAINPNTPVSGASQSVPDIDIQSLLSSGTTVSGEATESTSTGTAQ